MRAASNGHWRQIVALLSWLDDAAHLARKQEAGEHYTKGAMWCNLKIVNMETSRRSLTDRIKICKGKIHFYLSFPPEHQFAFGLSEADGSVLTLELQSWCERLHEMKSEAKENHHQLEKSTTDIFLDNGGWKILVSLMEWSERQDDTHKLQVIKRIVLHHIYIEKDMLVSLGTLESWLVYHVWFYYNLQCHVNSNKVYQNWKLPTSALYVKNSTTQKLTNVLKRALWCKTYYIYVCIISPAALLMCRPSVIGARPWNPLTENW